MKKRLELARAANLLLRRNGYRPDGRRRGTISGLQVRFERLAIRVPMGGKPSGR